jgi:hypothetical protein
MGEEARALLEDAMAEGFAAVEEAAVEVAYESYPHSHALVLLQCLNLWSSDGDECDMKMCPRACLDTDVQGRSRREFGCMCRVRGVD